MKTYFEQYRPFLIFLIKFFLVYVVVTFLYQYYLNQFDSAFLFQVDEFTQLVANQVNCVLMFLGYDSSIIPHTNEASVKLILNQIYVARVVEGCNALSVMILFAAFIVAFSGKWTHTVLYIIGGFFLIHVLNVFRIALLCIALLQYPKQEHFLHGVVFPLFIYGVVFGLWVIWVNKFSLHVRKNP
ncbi:exosortase family protein XrtF [Flavobacterium luteum]|uniref:Exosortase family protein XrtF n=1 Tax=Flavobacterium luteum TaxID=2026654 RepID=A0A7J5AGE9_9FLAO|nr:exosortase family protein XrtF [Flavobacterium luteum]KAB1156676.1 exosortase family protein XrtF [Flavobacterium luteum]